jgi:hypothetical protein
LVPAAAQAVDKSGKVKNWFAATRNVILEDGTECYLAAAINPVPTTLGVGKEVTLTYAAAGTPPVNSCSAIVVK